MGFGWVKEPIALFFVIGVVLFTWQSARYEDSVIVVNQDRLVRFMENRTKNFSGAIEERFGSMSEKARADVINQYIREEALHREALRLGLDREDYVIRQRLVQRMEYISQSANLDEPDEDTLREFYEQYRQDFYEPASVTFTHVFFRTADEARDSAEVTLLQLNDQSIPFERAPEFGERFVYQLNYVEKNLDELASHFGSDMARQVFELEPGSEWHGPFQSEHGFHLVLLTDHVAGRYSSFSEAERQVKERVLVMMQREQQDQRIKQIVDQYQLEISDELKAAAAQ